MAFFPLFIDPARHQGLLTFSVMAQTFLYGLAMTLLTHHLAERMRARSQLGQAAGAPGRPVPGRFRPQARAQPLSGAARSVAAIS